MSEDNGSGVDKPRIEAAQHAVRSMLKQREVWKDIEA